MCEYEGDWCYQHTPIKTIDKKTGKEVWIHGHPVRKHSSEDNLKMLGSILEVLGARNP
jgi:hypothetical protein